MLPLFSFTLLLSQVPPGVEMVTVTVILSSVSGGCSGVSVTPSPVAWEGWVLTVLKS